MANILQFVVEKKNSEEEKTPNENMQVWGIGP
jgi:hypothetical protein